VAARKPFEQERDHEKELQAVASPTSLANDKSLQPDGCGFSESHALTCDQARVLHYILS